MEDPIYPVPIPMSTGASAGRTGFFSMVPSGSASGSGSEVEVGADMWVRPTYSLEDADAEELIVDSEVDVDMDWDVEEWVDDDEVENLGLSDGYGSESLSEGDLSMLLGRGEEEGEGEGEEIADGKCLKLGM